MNFALSSEARTEPVSRPDAAAPRARSTAALHVVRDPGPQAGLGLKHRPSRRAVVRAQVWGVRTPAPEAAGQVVATPTAGPVTVTGVAEVLLLPGHAESQCYRISLAVSCAPVEGALPTVVGMELGGSSANVMPRRTTLRPGDQLVTLVVSGPAAKQPLTLVYELDGARHRASVDLDALPA